MLARGAGSIIEFIQAKQKIFVKIELPLCSVMSWANIWFQLLAAQCTLYTAYFILQIAHCTAQFIMDNLL